MKEALQIDDVAVVVEGEGPHTVVMLHGWPDTPALWDSTVAALREGYRCVRLCLPGYDLSKPPRAMSATEDDGELERSIARVSCAMASLATSLAL